jgi:hypothetical protein
MDEVDLLARIAVLEARVETLQMAVYALGRRLDSMEPLRHYEMPNSDDPAQK